MDLSHNGINKGFNWTRSMAALVVGVSLLSNVAGVYAAEGNFWKERNDAARRRTSLSLLAQLPRNAQSFTNGTEVIASLGRTPIENGFSSAKQMGWLSELVAPYGDIREVHLSSQPNAPLIVHLQDVHEVEEAQRNLAGLVEAFQTKRGISLIGLEGAVGPFDLDYFRSSSSTQTTRGLADTFLKLGYLTGPEVAGIVAAKVPTLWGIEDLPLYRGHIKAFEKSEEIRAKVRSALQDLSHAADEAREKIYSPFLRSIDDHRLSYQAHRESLGDYVSVLWDGLKKGQDSYPQVGLFIKALKSERALDFKEVERERLKLVEVLVHRLPSQTLDHFVQVSLAYRAGRLACGDYHRSLLSLCRKNGVRLEDYGSLNSYIAYILLAERIDSNDLLLEMDDLESSVLSSLAKTEDQRRLVAVRRGLVLLDKLTLHSLTPPEWQTFKNQKTSILNIPQTLSTLLGRQIPTIEGVFSESPSSFEDFCGRAMDRNSGLVQNLLAKMRADNINSSILVAGGFHTEGMAQLLRKEDVSYAIVSPKMTKLPENTRPLDIFVRAPLPLEKLLAGDAINLAYPRLTQNNREVLAATKNAIMRHFTLLKAWGLRMKEEQSKTTQTLESTIPEANSEPPLLRLLSEKVASALAVSRPASVWKEIPYFIPIVIGVIVAESLTNGLLLPSFLGEVVQFVGGMTAAFFYGPKFIQQHKNAEKQWLQSHPEKNSTDYRLRLLIAYGFISLATITIMVLSPQVSSAMMPTSAFPWFPGQVWKFILGSLGGGFLIHGFFNFFGRLFIGDSFVPAMGFWSPLKSSVETLSVSVGNYRHLILRDSRTKVSAHVEISSEANPHQRILFQLPSGQTALALPAHSDTPWAWKVLTSEPIRSDGGFRGMGITLLADRQHKVTIDLPGLLLLNVVSLRMELFYGRPVREQEKKFLQYLKGLSLDKKTAIQELIPSPIEEIIEPRVSFVKNSVGAIQGVEIHKTTFDGRRHYRVFIALLSKGTAALTPDGELQLEGDVPIEISLRMDSDVEPLTPIPFEKIFTPKARRAMAKDASFQQAAERFAALVYGEKLLAGSWMYPSYFGRDTLVAARLMWPALTMQVKGIILQSVLNRLGHFSIDGSPSVDGWVAVSDERNGEYLFHETVVEFCRLMGEGREGSAVDLVRHALSGPRELPEYHVLDGNVLLTGLLARYLLELDPSERQMFLDRQNARGETNLDSVLAHANVLMQMTRPYVAIFQKLREEHPDENLVGLTKLDKFHQTSRRLVRIQPDPHGQDFIGNWRDSIAALGFGKFPADINAFLIPSALASLEEILDLLGRTSTKLKERVSDHGWPLLNEVLEGRVVLGRARDAWSTAEKHFQVSFPMEEVRRRLSNYLAWEGHPQEYRRRLGRRLLAPGISVKDFVTNHGDPQWLKKGFTFTAVALDEDGRPVPIVNSDEVFSLLETNLPSSETRRLLDFWSRPFPVGLWSEAGALISNSVLSENPYLWRVLDHQAYHGNVIWGWVTAALGMGWARQYKIAENNSDKEKILQILGDFLSLRRLLGPLAYSEVWSWVFEEDGRMTPKELVHGIVDNVAGQPAVPIQLWSASAFSVDPNLEEAAAQIRGGDRISVAGPRAEGGWQRLQKAGELSPRLLEKWRLLKEDALQVSRDRRARIPRHRRQLQDLGARGPPGGIRVAFLHFTAPPRVSGVDIVMTEQARWLARMGISVRVVAGNRSSEFDSVPHLDYRAIEGLSTMEEAEIDQQIEHVFRDQDVVVLHNVLSVPMNLALTASLHRYITAHPEKHFIVFVHNAMEREEAHYPLRLMNPTLSFSHVTYVTVSKAYREVMARCYPRAPPFGVIPPGLWAYNPDFLTTEAAEDFSQHGLFKQDLVMVLPTRVDWNKDIPKGLQILEALTRRRQKTKLILVVPGVTSFNDLVRETRINRDDGAADWLEKNMRDIAEKYVVFLDATRINGFPRHRQYLMDLMALSDVLLMPSRMESFGMPAIEAVSVRTVVAASDLAPHVETMGKGSPLFSIEESPGIIADRLLDYLDRYSPRDLGPQQRSVIDRFEWDNVMADQFLPILEKGVDSLPRAGTAVLLCRRGETVRAYEHANKIFHVLATHPGSWRDIIGDTKMVGVADVFSTFRADYHVGENPELAILRERFVEPALAALARQFPSEIEKVDEWLALVQRIVPAIDLLTNDHRHTIALNTLGDFHRFFGRWKEAQMAYVESKRIDPANGAASAGLDYLAHLEKELAHSPGGRWPLFETLYGWQGKSWAGQVLMPVLVEWVLPVGGIFWAMAHHGMVLTPELLVGGVLVYQIVWHLFHLISAPGNWKEKIGFAFSSEKRWISYGTIVLALFAAVYFNFGVSPAVWGAQIISYLSLPHLAVNSHSLKASLLGGPAEGKLKTVSFAVEIDALRERVAHERQELAKQRQSLALSLELGAEPEVLTMAQKLAERHSRSAKGMKDKAMADEVKVLLASAYAEGGVGKVMESVRTYHLAQGIMDYKETLSASIQKGREIALEVTSEMVSGKMKGLSLAAQAQWDRLRMLAIAATEGTLKKPVRLILQEGVEPEIVRETLLLRECGSLVGKNSQTISKSDLAVSAGKYSVDKFLDWLEREQGTPAGSIPVDIHLMDRNEWDFVGSLRKNIRLLVDVLPGIVFDATSRVAIGIQRLLVVDITA